MTVDGAGGGPVWTFGGKPVQPGTSIPVTRIRVPLLIGDGGQDGLWDAVIGVLPDLRIACPVA